MIHFCSNNFDWCSENCLNCFWTDENNTSNELFSANIYSFIFLLQLCSKCFHCCSPKCSNRFWPDRRHTLGFLERTYRFSFLFLLCSKSFGWCSPNCPYTDKKNVFYELFRRKFTTLYFCSSSALKNRLMFPKLFFTLEEENIEGIFSGEKLKLCLCALICLEQFWLIFSKLFPTRWEGHFERIFFLRKSLF